MTTDCRIVAGDVDPARQAVGFTVRRTMQSIAVLLGVLICVVTVGVWELRGIRIGSRAETPAQRVALVASCVLAFMVAVWTVFALLRG